MKLKFNKNDFKILGYILFINIILVLLIALVTIYMSKRNYHPAIGICGVLCFCYFNVFFALYTSNKNNDYSMFAGVNKNSDKERVHELIYKITMGYGVSSIIIQIFIIIAEFLRVENMKLFMLLGVFVYVMFNFIFTVYVNRKPTK